MSIDKIIERTNKTIEPILGTEKSILKKINEYYELQGKVQDIETKTDPNFNGRMNFIMMIWMKSTFKIFSVQF